MIGEIAKGTVANVYEFDFTKRAKMDKVGKFYDIEKAREKAKEVAEDWCEWERAGLVNHSFTYEQYGGESDFGTIIVLEADY